MSNKQKIKNRNLLILTELEENARRFSHPRSNNSMHYSSRRRSRRDSIRSSKSDGSQGDCSEKTLLSSISERSVETTCSDNSSSDRSRDSLNSSKSKGSQMRGSHQNIMDELEEKVARMNVLSTGTRRRSSGSGNWRRSSRRSRGSPHRRSPSLGSCDGSVGSSGRSVGSLRRSRSSGSSGGSSRRSPKRGRREEHTRRRSSSSGARATNASSAVDSPPSMPVRDSSPSLPCRSNTTDLPEKEPLRVASHSTQSRRRSPSGGAGGASGSFQVTQSRNISLSSSSSRSRSGKSRRRSRNSRSSARGNSNADHDSTDGEDSSAPGAFSVDGIGEISVIPPSSHTVASSLNSWPEETEEEDMYSGAENTTCTRSFLMSVNEETEEGSLIQASVAQDYEDDLEEAREQGRREALTEVTRHNSGDIVVAVPRDHDDESQGDSVVDEKQRSKVLCWAFLLCCLLITVGVAVASILFIGNDNGVVEPMLEEDVDSNLKGVIVYTPPTPEECEAIASGTLMMEDRMSLIQRSFDIQIEITLASEADFGALLSDLIQHIQQKLIPFMAGCLNFFDATIAITDGITANNGIADGQVQKDREQACGADPIGKCKSYVLILDLYLEDDRSNAMLLETIGHTVTSSDIASTLGDIYPVQTASVCSIVPLNDDVTPGLEPTQCSVNSRPVATPTLAPMLGTEPMSPTAVPSKGSSSPSSSPVTGPTAAPTREPTASPTKTPTASPTKSPRDTPSRVPTDEPSLSPSMITPMPSKSPTLSPVAGPTEAPSSSPTTAPSRSPTASPSKVPTVTPSKSPTTSPSKSPSTSPSKVPTDTPSNSPSTSPSKSPTANPTNSPTDNPTESPTDNPTKAPTESPTDNPTKAPTANPTQSPTDNPTTAPTPNPTHSPTASPTTSPTFVPSGAPSMSPSETPPVPATCLAGRAACTDGPDCCSGVCIVRGPRALCT